jgi:hypothetical protein
MCAIFETSLFARWEEKFFRSSRKLQEFISCFMRALRLHQANQLPEAEKLIAGATISRNTRGFL